MDSCASAGNNSGGGPSSSSDLTGDGEEDEESSSSSQDSPIVAVGEEFYDESMASAERIDQSSLAWNAWKPATLDEVAQPETNSNLEDFPPLTSLVGDDEDSFEEDDKIAVQSDPAMVAGAGNPKGVDFDRKKGEIVSALERFRFEWKEELSKSEANSSGSNSSSRDVSRGVSPEPSKQRLMAAGGMRPVETDYDRAKSLFTQGVEEEKCGNMYEAIRFYRQALQIVPDIERKVYQTHPKRPISSRNSLEKRLPPSRTYSPAPFVSSEADPTELEHADDTVLNYDELESRLYATGERLLCAREHDQTQTVHISQMPIEVVVRLARWLISDEVDMSMLEKMGQVCCGFFLLARDPELWHSACQSIWGIRTGILDKSDIYLSWRDMFIFRPRVWFNGIYISKCTYVRHGEASFQDKFYRPWHLVVYYRYIRFFSDGYFMMLTTSEEPVVAINYLRNRNSRSNQVLTGSYQFIGKDTLSGVLRRPKKSSLEAPVNPFGGRFKRPMQSSKDPDHMFNVEFKISPTKRKLHAQLSWLQYEIVTNYRTDQGLQRSCFDLTEQAFPPFYYSRVKSFTAPSEAPLA